MLPYNIPSDPVGRGAPRHLFQEAIRHHRRDAQLSQVAGRDMPEKPPHNPWESGLKERQAKEAKTKEDKEAKDRAAKETKEREEREQRAAREAERPKPTGPPKGELLALVAQAQDKDAKIGLLKGRAADLFKQGFPLDAAEMYTHAITLQATHTLHSNRSACRCAHGDYEGALEDAYTCVCLDRLWAKGYVRKGAALHGLHRFDEAVEAYEEGLRVEPENKVLSECLADALKRRKAAGGAWEVCVDGRRLSEQSTKDGVTRLPQLGGVVRAEEAAMVPFAQLVMGAGEHVVALDGTRPKIFSTRSGHAVREFNTAFEASGCSTFQEAPSGLAIDPTGVDPALYSIEPKKGMLRRLRISDSRSAGCRKEAPDKIMNEVRGGRALGLSSPMGMAFVDTSRMGGGGADATLYVCDADNGRVLALDPKELVERFAVGRAGSGDGELTRPVSVCACGDLLAVADAGAHRVVLFTLRGTFLRNIGEQPSKFSSGTRAGQFVRPPAHVAMAPGHLFVLEEKGSRIHVLSPTSGEPLGVLLPPYNAKSPLDERGGLDPTRSEGCLRGLCVDADALYVGSTCGAPRILKLPREKPAGAPELHGSYHAAKSAPSAVPPAPPCDDGEAVVEVQ